ncbi:hypothetical protein DM860_002062 [Cuscuta australis]|uniref:Uncharacterized protein n=1 Tax=Cuscuta australis TaxID=267555 RepID=A0A328E003_9ASTE|nr:hypothetical protein DM860_002062 [Cuscuta australis]
MHLPTLLIFGLGVMLDIGAAILCIMAQFAQYNKVKKESCRQAIIDDEAETYWKIGVILFVIVHAYAGIIAFLRLIMRRDRMHRIMKTYAVAFICISCCTFIAGAILLGLGRKIKESSNGSCVTTHPHFLVYGGLVCFGHGALTFIGCLTTIRCVQEKFGDDDSENANYYSKGHSSSP